MNFHLVRDNPFYIDEFIQKSKEISDSDNIFICIGNKKDSLKRVKSQEVKICSIEEALKKLKNENFKKLFIHFLDSKAISFLKQVDADIIVYWLLWGSDAYKHPDLLRNIYMPMTSETLKKMPFGKYNAKYSLVQKMRDFRFKRNFSKAIHKIDFCCIQVKEDFVMMKKLYPHSKMKHKYFAYKGADPKLCEGNRNRNENHHKSLNLLVGNSANPSNNHKDVLKMLYDYNDVISSITCPLSYSGPIEYVDEVINYGKELFGNKFVGLKNFLPFEDYQVLMNKIDVGVFYHRRQQAYANTLLMLQQNKKIFMNDHSNLFKMYQELDVQNVYVDFQKLVSTPLFSNNMLCEKLGQNVIDNWYSELLNN